MFPATVQTALPSGRPGRLPAASVVRPVVAPVAMAPEPAPRVGIVRSVADAVALKVSPPTQLGRAQLRPRQ